MNKVLLSAISLLAISTAVNAADFLIVNQNKKELEVRFEASDDSKIFKEFKIAATGVTVDPITINSSDLGGKELIAIRATVNGVTHNMSDSCSKLPTTEGKKSKLVFTDDKVNTTCEAVELTDDQWDAATASSSSDHHAMDSKMDSKDSKATKM